MAGGRQSKLTLTVQNDIIKGIRAGLTYEQAAALAGVGESTFYLWKSKGEKQHSGRYVEFLEALKKANVEARAIHLQRIHKASQGGESFEEVSVCEKTEINPTTGKERVVARETRTTKKMALPVWQASAWILERRFSSEFGRHTTPAQPEERDPMQDWMDGLEEAAAKFGD